ncbi:MAG TPA: hypothetical protein VGS57_22905 [Thermoanaerobaculia bacterium]|jgi:hypothetical protein|nr:hypothetical protein [Thermoanaerobaculia bacterium]
MAAEPAAPHQEPRAAPLGWIAGPSLLLAAGALLLAWRERPHVAEYTQRIFKLLFARDEPAGAALLLATTAVAVAAGFAVARSARMQAWATSVPERLGARRRVLAIAVVSALLLAIGAVTVYEARPLAMDEYAHWFQARAFAAGELTGRFPPNLLPHLVPPRLLYPFFATDATTGTVASTYWPGFALLLVPFTWLRAPWLLNPLLGGGSLLLLAALARRWTGEAAAAGWAVLLALASPAFTVNALSFYPLTAHLLLNLVWMALLVERSAAGNDESASRADSSPASLPVLTTNARRLLAAGAVGSLALVLHNPVPHAIFALPWIGALMRRRGVRAVAWLALGYLPLVLLLGVGWMRVRGLVADPSAGVATSGALARAADFLAHAFALPSDTLLYARLLGLAELLTWAAPFLLVLAAFGWRTAHRGSPLRLLAVSALATLLLYAFIPFDQGHGWGYRYFHAAWSALPLLGAAALVDPRAARWRVPVLAAALLAIPTANALRAAQVHSFIAEHRAQLPPMPRPADGERYICFVSLQDGFYRVDLLQNDPFLRDPVTYLASDGFARDAELVARSFPRATLSFRGSDGSVWRLASYDVGPLRPP